MNDKAKYSSRFEFVRAFSCPHCGTKHYFFSVPPPTSFYERHSAEIKCRVCGHVIESFRAGDSLSWEIYLARDLDGLTLRQHYQMHSNLILGIVMALIMGFAIALLFWDG